MKNQKGITLIALVITIIVLLILAGVTIAMLTGTDSAPVKANEAKQKQDIGSAKDQVMLYAQEYQTIAYDMIYVKGVSKTGTAQTQGASNKTGEIGTLVGNCIKATSIDSVKGIINPTGEGVIPTNETTSTTDVLNSKKVGLATIKTSGNKIGTQTETSGATAYVQITTTDFVTYGHIEGQGGALVWDDTIKAITNADN